MTVAVNRLTRTGATGDWPSGRLAGARPGCAFGGHRRARSTLRAATCRRDPRNVLPGNPAWLHPPTPCLAEINLLDVRW